MAGRCSHQYSSFDSFDRLCRKAKKKLYLRNHAHRNKQPFMWSSSFLSPADFGPAYNENWSIKPFATNCRSLSNSSEVQRTLRSLFSTFSFDEVSLAVEALRHVRLFFKTRTHKLTTPRSPNRQGEFSTDFLVFVIAQTLPKKLRIN